MDGNLSYFFPLYPSFFAPFSIPRDLDQLAPKLVLEPHLEVQILCLDPSPLTHVLIWCHNDLRSTIVFLFLDLLDVEWQTHPVP